LSAQFAKLAPADQMVLINDSRMLGYAGYEPLSDFLSLARNVSPEMDPTVLSALVSRLQGIDQLYYDLPGQAAYRQFARKVLNPLFARVGWAARQGESQNVALLRENLLDALSEFGDPAVVEGARQRFAAYLKDSSTLSGDLRRSVLHILAQHADAKTWDQLHALARKADSSLEKTQLYSLLGLPYDRAQAQRALALALTDEAVVTTRPLFLGSVSERYPEMAFDFAVAHWPVIRAMLEPDSRNEFVPELASGSYEASTIPKLRAFAAKNIPANAMSAERKAEGSIAEFAKIRSQRLPDVDHWLKTHGS
jgi:aminopeptidase N